MHYAEVFKSNILYILYKMSLNVPYSVSRRGFLAGRAQARVAGAEKVGFFLCVVARLLVERPLYDPFFLFLSCQLLREDT